MAFAWGQSDSFSPNTQEMLPKSTKAINFRAKTISLVSCFQFNNFNSRIASLAPLRLARRISQYLREESRRACQCGKLPKLLPSRFAASACYFWLQSGWQHRCLTRSECSCRRAPRALVLSRGRRNQRETLCKESDRNCDGIKGSVVPDVPACRDRWLRRLYRFVKRGVGLAKAVSEEHFP